MADMSAVGGGISVILWILFIIGIVLLVVAIFAKIHKMAKDAKGGGGAGGAERAAGEPAGIASAERTAEKLTKGELGLMQKELQIDKLVARMSRELDRLLGELEQQLGEFYNYLGGGAAARWKDAKRATCISAAIRISKEIKRLVEQEYKRVTQSKKISGKIGALSGDVAADEMLVESHLRGAVGQLAGQVDFHAKHVRALEAYNLRLESQEARLLVAIHKQIETALKNEFEAAARGAQARLRVITDKTALQEVRRARIELRQMFTELAQEIRDILTEVHEAEEETQEEGRVPGGFHPPGG